MRPRPLGSTKSCAFFDEDYPRFKYKNKSPHSTLAGDLAEHVTSPEEAEIISEQIGPRVRTLTDKYSKNEIADKYLPAFSKKHTIMTFGCSGKRTPGQRAVAALLNDTIATHQFNVKAVLHSGDLLYPAGATSATDPIFQTTFYSYYSDTEYRYLRPIPFRAVLGNHEYNDSNARYWKERLKPPFKEQSGKPRGRHIIRHAHMDHIEDPTISVSKKTLLSNPELDVSEAPKFGMEYYFGSDIDGKVQYIYLNSSTLLSEFLDYKYHILGITELSPEQLRTNQFVFLLKTYSECKAAGRAPIVMMHHPLINMGDRNIIYDSHLYNSPRELTILDRILQLPLNCSPTLIQRILLSSEKDIDTIPGVPLPTIDANNYCLLLARLFASHNMQFRSVLCAHEHMMSVIRTDGIPNVSQNYLPTDKKKTPILSPYPRPDDLSKYTVFQILSGGGGGDLQDPHSWNLGENIGCCIKANGMCALSYDPEDPKELTVDLYTVDTKLHEKEGKLEGLHLKFNDKGPRPIINKSPELEEYKQGAILRELINTACFKYQIFLEREMKKSGGTFLGSLVKSVVKTVTSTIMSFFRGEPELKLAGNLTHKMNDVLIMNEMQTYVNSYKPIQFTEAIEKLYHLSQQLKNINSPDSFIRDINDQLFAKFDKNLEELYESIQRNRMRLK